MISVFNRFLHDNPRFTEILNNVDLEAACWSYAKQDNGVGRDQQSHPDRRENRRVALEAILRCA
ncbi:hypothetical protein [Mycolicibacterium helvum]|uniref:hypothetical protein n=1 Tax=Mycolicibacterium helvum TaxID=1534349 RepID=UPI0013D4A7B7|nr:hypothetical protein [Mycolicibacterium helvum]